MTVQEVVDEITNKRQLRRLIVLPYDLIIKDVFPENIRAVTDFAKKTGDYPSLSATDLKVMALTYQLEKEKVGTEHLRQEPVVQRTVNVSAKLKKEEIPTNVSGFFLPSTLQAADDESDEEMMNEDVSTDEGMDLKIKSVNDKTSENIDLELPKTDVDNKEIDIEKLDKDLNEKFATLQCVNLENVIDGQNIDEILPNIENSEENDINSNESGYEDDDDGWITPTNLQKAKKQMNEDLVEDKPAVVACITTDFAMQNVLKQMNLKVAALDGRMIKQLRTFILRCYTCFKTTSKMEKQFCPKCGNKTLKKVAVSLDENGKQVIHINARRPLTARGKKFSLPTFQGGKHSSNPILTEDQPVPQQRPSRQARMKNNPMDDDYIAGITFTVTIYLILFTI